MTDKSPKLEQTADKIRIGTHDESVGAVTELCRILEKRGRIKGFTIGEYDSFVDVFFG